MSFITTDAEKAAGRPGGDSEGPRVFVVQDSMLHRMHLSKLLALCHCDVIEILPNAVLPGDLLEIDESPDLFIFPIRVGDQDGVERIGRVHADENFRETPILGIADLRELPIPIEDLRSLGIVGVVDRNANVEHIAFRISQIVRPSLQRRRWERVESFFPVLFEADGRQTRGMALNISSGGMSVQSVRAVEINTDVSVAFRLEREDADLKLEGRVVQSGYDPKTVPSYHLGIVFYPLDNQSTEILDRAMCRLKAE